MKRHALRASLLAAIAALTFAAAGCQTSAPPADPAPLRSELPSLPDDGPGWSKHLASTTLTIAGPVTYLTSGEPGVAVNPQHETWLTLDGDLAGEMAWAIWQFPLPDETNVEDIVLRLQQSYPSKYWVLWADYDLGRWVPAEESQFSQYTLSGLGPGARSQGNYVYVAVVVLPGNKINIDTIDFTHDGGGPQDPIFDQFENNDDTHTAYVLEPGIYRASIHETIRIDMTDPEEYQDFWDFYKISLTAGQYLVTTMRHEEFDHFDPFPLFYNDLDILFYMGETDFPLNDFVEQYSSIGVFDPFEQSIYHATAGGSVIIGIRGELEGVSNAEYDAGFFVVNSPHSVSGFVKQEGNTVTKDYVVFLEPGNFNANTPPVGEGTPGEFHVEGVPDGTYDIKVHTNYRDVDVPLDYVWDPDMQVVVSGGDVSGLSVDIGPDP